MKSWAVPALDYESALAALAQMQTRGVRLELDRMRALAEALGVPSGGTAKFVHVAGTNGKGTTTAFVQSALNHQAIRCGGYFSPYVYDMRERVQRNGEHISKSDFARLMGDIVSVGDDFLDSRFGGPTEFEAKTALGFLYWQEQRCEAVALEVGLGGRLDATNIVTPSVSVITSIGLDHTLVLGDTLAKIAAEKAGIIKHRRPVVVGDLAPEGLEVVLRTAEDLDAPCLVYGRDFVVEGSSITTPRHTYKDVTPGIQSAKSMHNAALALVALEVAGLMNDPVKASEGIRSARIPGRFEIHTLGPTTLVLDGAHNAQAAEILRETLLSEFPGVKWRLVTGMIEGHDPTEFYRALAPVVLDAKVISVPEPRTRRPSELVECVRAAGIAAEAAASVNEAVGDPFAHPHLLATGSFFLLADVKAAMLQVEAAPR